MHQLTGMAAVPPALVQPYRLVEHAPGSLVLGLGVALPLGLSWLSRNAYMRELSAAAAAAHSREQCRHAQQ